MKPHPSVLQHLLLLATLALLPYEAVASQEHDPPPTLVLISVDGMRPDYVTKADEHGAKVPELRRFLKEGTYAEGVEGDIPTVTYPSHTTLVTGVWPAKHGILANTVFDPLRENDEAWYWYAEDIRVPTLWDAAEQAGRKTASIQWPVTVGAHIDWNLPEMWRGGGPDDQKLVRALSTPGLIAEAAPEIGLYVGGFEASPESDEVRGRYAEWILENKHPGLLTLHLSSLDHIEHDTVPFSPEAMAVLERMDTVIGQIRETAERTTGARAILAIVSDHGFVKTDKALNLFAAFREAGLFRVDSKGKIQDWKAMPWLMGGGAAIVIKDGEDTATRARVKQLLAKIANEPEYGIDRVLDAEELHQRGGFPTATFFVGLKPGWRTGGGLKGPILESVEAAGTHGALPDLPDLRSSFFAVGPGIPAGRNLGVIDMRDIAPTLAHAAGLLLPSADGKNFLP